MENKTESIPKIKVESTTPAYIQLERALIIAYRELGWKSLTCFLVKWCQKNQPATWSYTLYFWLKEGGYIK